MLAVRRGVGLLAMGAVVAPVLAAGAQQRSDFSVSPFVTFMSTAGASPLAGLAFTLTGTGGLALRASGHVALENDNTVTLNVPGAFRPWGADADALFFFDHASGFNRGLAPFVFAGVGRGTRDSSATQLTRDDWSYGAGIALPVAGAVDLFGQARWRMSRFVLPTATGAPSPAAEFEFGVTLHVGGGPDAPRRGRGRRFLDLPARLAAACVDQH
jgi:hypothetical protein